MESQSAAAPTPTSKRYTLEEYFDFEYKASQKHEFWDGQIRAMSYTSPRHGDIQTNLSDALAACLKGKGCKRYTSDRMVFVPGYNKVFYPDLVIVCGEQILDGVVKVEAVYAGVA